MISTDRKFGRCSTQQGSGERRGVGTRRAEEPDFCVNWASEQFQVQARRTSQEETCVLAQEG